MNEDQPERNDEDDDEEIKLAVQEYQKRKKPDTSKQDFLETIFSERPNYPQPRAELEWMAFKSLLKCWTPENIELFVTSWSDDDTQTIFPDSLYSKSDLSEETYISHLDLLAVGKRARSLPDDEMFVLVAGEDPRLQAEREKHSKAPRARAKLSKKLIDFAAQRMQERWKNDTAEEIRTGLMCKLVAIDTQVKIWTEINDRKKGAGEMDDPDYALMEFGSTQAKTIRSRWLPEIQKAISIPSYANRPGNSTTVEKISAERIFNKAKEQAEASVPNLKIRV